MDKKTRRVGPYIVNLVETYDNDPVKAQMGLDLWRHFVRNQRLPSPRVPDPLDSDGTNE